MREIKLRYKCRNKDKLFYDGDDNFAYITRHKIIALGNGGMLFAEETMQYTGLTDKNGKEIYEGDKIKDFLDNKEGVVEFIDGSFCIVGAETFAIDLFEFLEESSSSTYITGNIYES